MLIKTQRYFNAEREVSAKGTKVRNVTQRNFNKAIKAKQLSNRHERLPVVVQ